MFVSFALAALRRNLHDLLREFGLVSATWSDDWSDDDIIDALRCEFKDLIEVKEQRAATIRVREAEIARLKEENLRLLLKVDDIIEQVEEMRDQRRRDALKEAWIDL